MGISRDPVPGSGNWNDSKTFLARSCHIGWAIAVFSSCVLHGFSPFLVALGILTLAFIKEFWCDWKCPDLPEWLFPGWLENDTFEGSVQDFCFYGIGVFICALSLWFFWVAVLLAVLVMVGLTLLDMADQNIYPF